MSETIDFVFWFLFELIEAEPGTEAEDPRQEADRRIDGDVLPFDLVRDRIAGYLDETVRRRAQQQYVSILAGRARLTGVDLAAARGPLVQ